MVGSSRYFDLRSNASGAAGGVPDFAARKRYPAVVTLMMVMVVTLLICILLSLLVQNRTLLVAALFAIIGGAGWYATLAVQRSYDLLLATEFQNALFSSAIGINHKFCLIIKQDGMITYLDRAFQDMFPAFLRQPQRTLDVWLDHSKVTREDREEILASIERGGFSKVIFVVRTGHDEFHKIVMSVEPILRPHGFILLRGREFIEKRSSEGMDSAFQQFDMLNKSVVTLFSHVVGTMNMGMYMTGPLGNIIYTNSVLDQWLGFADGEIISCGLSLKDIIHPDSGPHAVAIENREMPIMLQAKHGGKVTSFLSQRVIRDDHGKITGCSALLHDAAVPVG